MTSYTDITKRQYAPRSNASGRGHDAENGARRCWYRASLIDQIRGAANKPPMRRLRRTFCHASCKLCRPKNISHAHLITIHALLISWPRTTTKRSIPSDRTYSCYDRRSSFLDTPRYDISQIFMQPSCIHQPRVLPAHLRRFHQVERVYTPGGCVRGMVAHDSCCRSSGATMALRM